MKLNGNATSLSVTGVYAYAGEGGKLYIIRYTADENGFQPRVTILNEKEAVDPSLFSSTPGEGKIKWGDHYIDENVIKTLIG